MINNIFKQLLFIVLFSSTLFAEIKLTQTEVSELYVTLMGRVSEGKGSNYWQNNYSNQTEAANAMLGSVAVARYFNVSNMIDMSNENFIETIYKNTLNKTRDGSDETIKDESGIDYWLGRLTGNTGAKMTRAEMIVQFITIAQQSTTVSGQQFSNRVEVSNYMADMVETPPDDYETSMSFSSGLRVTADKGSIESAKERISSLVDGKNSEDKSQKGLGGLIPTEEMLLNIPVALPPVSSYASNELPSSYDLSDRMPPVRNQGGQGSCASWAVGYYLKSYHEHLDKDTDYGEGNDYEGAYSPAFLYNHVKVDSCDGGSYISDNLDRIRDIGIPSWKDMPYNDNNCNAKPSAKATKNAKCARILDYQRLRTHKPIESIEMKDMKYYLSHDNPLVIGIYTFDGFSTPKKYNGEFFYKNYSEKKYYGGHAIVVVGYDDSRNAFKIINSWGKDWGNDGFLWIDYDVFSRIVFIVYRTEDALNECEEDSSYISIDKQSLVFNTKPIDASYKKTFNISNKGSIAFNISDISVPSGYTVDWTRGTVEAGKSQAVTVTFSPTENKLYNGKITIEHDADKGKNSIELVGAGIDGESPNFPPIAKAGDDITVKVGESVKLDASNSTDSDGMISSYEWRVGTTLLSSSQVFEKSDFGEGEHRVTLKVTDDEGLTDTDTIVVTISDKENLSPLAKAGTNLSIKFGENVTLDASKSTDSDGEIVAYEWKEENKLLSNSSSFSKKDFSVGKHTITLTVTDNDGATDKDIVTVTVAKEGNLAPIANAGADITITLGGTISLDASKSSDSDGEIVEYKWSYNSSENSTNNYISNSPYRSFTPQRLFTGKTYLFTLTVKDNDGQIDTDTIIVNVTGSERNLAPIADIGVSSINNTKPIFLHYDITVRPNEKISFYSSNSYDNDGDIVSYEWKEGNQILSTNDEFTKSDFSIGKHTVTLTVTDNDRAVGIGEISITIGREENIKPTAHAGEDQTITLGGEIILDASKSSDSDGNIVQYDWNWKNYGMVTSNSISSSFTPYLTVGIHTFTLTIRDNDGGIDTDTMTVTVE